MVLLANFVLHRLQTSDVDFVCKHWRISAFQLSEDGVLRLRSQQMEYEAVTPAWEYLLRHPTLVKDIRAPGKPDPNAWKG